MARIGTRASIYERAFRGLKEADSVGAATTRKPGCEHYVNAARVMYRAAARYAASGPLHEAEDSLREGHNWLRQARKCIRRG